MRNAHSILKRQKPYTRHNDLQASRGRAPLILSLGTRWRWVLCLMPRPFHPKEKALLVSNGNWVHPKRFWTRDNHFWEWSVVAIAILKWDLQKLNIYIIWVQLAHDKVKWKDLINMVSREKIRFTSWVTVSLQKEMLLLGFGYSTLCFTWYKTKPQLCCVK